MSSETGVADARRMIAAITDNLFAGLIAVILNGLLRGSSDAISIIIICVSYFGYFVFFESLWARTPGKMLTGLIIRKIDGTQLGLKDALFRTALRVFEVNPILAGGIPAGLFILFTKRKQRLGDLLAGTIIVRQ